MDTYKNKQAKQLRKQMRKEESPALGQEPVLRDGGLGVKPLSDVSFSGSHSYGAVSGFQSSFPNLRPACDRSSSKGPTVMGQPYPDSGFFLQP